VSLMMTIGRRRAKETSKPARPLRW